MLILGAELGAMVFALVGRGARAELPPDAVRALPLRLGEKVPWVGTTGRRIFAIGGILCAVACAIVGALTRAAGQSGAAQSVSGGGSIIAATVGVLAG